MTPIIIKTALADPQVNDGKMSARWVITSERIDREGDVVLTRGGDLSDHRKVPAVLLNHDSSALIGKTESPDGLYTVEPRPELGKMFATVYYQQSTKLGQESYELVKGGFLRGASIGFQVRKSEARGKAEKNGRPPLLIKEWSLVELSNVPVPMNPDAVREVIERRFDGKPLHPHLAKMLQPYASEPKVWANGADVKGFDPNEPRDEDGKWTTGGGKEHHEMTRAEYGAQDEGVKQIDATIQRIKNGNPGVMDVAIKESKAAAIRRHQRARDIEMEHHKRAVSRALRAGKTVPSHVLDEYPDLKEDYAGVKAMPNERIQSIMVKADAFPDWLAAKTWLAEQGYEVGDAPTATDENGSRFDFFPADDIADGTGFDVALSEKAVGRFAVSKSAPVVEPLPSMEENRRAISDAMTAKINERIVAAMEEVISPARLAALEKKSLEQDAVIAELKKQLMTKAAEPADKPKAPAPTPAPAPALDLAEATALEQQTQLQLTYLAARLRNARRSA